MLNGESPRKGKVKKRQGGMREGEQKRTHFEGWHRPFEVN